MEQLTQGHTTSKLVMWDFNPRQPVVNAYRGKCLIQTVDAQTFLKFSQLPRFTGVGRGVCVEVWGYCEGEGGEGEVFILSLLFSELVSDSIIPHDYWVKNSHFLFKMLPPNKPSKDNRLIIGV